jgi:hypothetical protein
VWASGVSGSIAATGATERSGSGEAGAAVTVTIGAGTILGSTEAVFSAAARGSTGSVAFA